MCLKIQLNFFFPIKID